VEDKSQTEWKKLLEDNRIKYGKCTEEIHPPGNKLKYEPWKTLNRSRIKAARTKRRMFINLQYLISLIYLNVVLF